MRPSGQQPCGVCAHCLVSGAAGSQPSKSFPLASVTPSGQQPNSPKEQDLTTSSSGSVVLSAISVLSGVSVLSAVSVDSVLSGDIVLSGTSVVSPDPSVTTSTVVVGGAVVVSGHPSFSSPSEGVKLSGQHPNNVSAHCDLGHPSLFSPSAGETPSEQHPYLVSAHVLTIGQPASNEPLAGVFLSGQHP